jgi:putative chitinase
MPFAFNFTQDKLQECLAKNREIDQWFPVVYAQLEHFEINTVQRAAAFLAQCSHESMDFTVTHENLNYQAQGLMRVFPHYFPDEATASQYAHNPEAIANRIYGNRMGNRDEASGDGYRFRGRGIVQLTGHDNYLACSKAVFGDGRLLDSPDWLESKEGCVVGACWFWNAHGLNAWADADDIKEITHRINGGYIGLEERTQKYNAFCDILADNS